ncbi:MAG: MerR family transcriptional regulator [Nocardioidaceae bacterium]
MYTIKEAARITGVPETSLRAWERRYSVVEPRRTEAGYRIYDDSDLAAVAAMRDLVADGWSPAEAARAVREGRAGPESPESPESPGTTPADSPPPVTLAADPAVALFVAAAARLDTDALEESLDLAFSAGTFEHVLDSWLFPALRALGEAWARGEVDVAGEHAASHAVHRRLSMAFAAAGRQSRGPTVVVGLAPGSRHELGALAFATAIRRRGLDVLYLGADVPEASWDAAVSTRGARAAVLAVVTASDRPAAASTLQRLVVSHPGLLVAAGGSFGAALGAGVHSLTGTVAQAARELDALLPVAPR